MAKEQNAQDLQIELLKAQLENLNNKVSKPQTTEEMYQARCDRYDALESKRNELRASIDKRRMEIMLMPELLGKARMDEVILLESWERRAASLEKSNPAFSDYLKGMFKRKLRDIKQDSLR